MAGELKHPRMTQKFASHITHFTPTIPATTGHITAGVREWLSETSTQGRREPSRLSTRHVQDGIRFVRMLFQLFDGLGGRENEQGDLAAFRFFLYIVHHRQATRPVPIIKRLHFQGIFSSIETGVCLNSSRNFLEGFFLRLHTSPRSITTSCS